MCPSAPTIFSAADASDAADETCTSRKGMCTSREGTCRIGGLGLTQEALDICGFVPGSSLADIGCGNGATVRYLRAAGFDATGLDRDEEIITQAGPHCRLGDSSCLPYQDKSLDGLFFECSFSQMQGINTAQEPKLGQVLTEARRVLKSDGKLIISDLYFRNERYGGFLQSRSEWIKTITKADFTVILFEDKSVGFAEAAAQLLWQHGGEKVKELCGCGMDELKAGRCGYFLLIAHPTTEPKVAAVQKEES